SPRPWSAVIAAMPAVTATLVRGHRRHVRCHRRPARGYRRPALPSPLPGAVSRVRAGQGGVAVSAGSTDFEAGRPQGCQNGFPRVEALAVDLLVAAVVVPALLGEPAEGDDPAGEEAGLGVLVDVDADRPVRPLPPAAPGTARALLAGLGDVEDEEAAGT